MAVSVDLIKQLVDVTNDSNETIAVEKTLLASAVVNDTGIYVKIDGSDVLTPVSMATDARDGDRVLVSIANHRANIVGNLTSPSSGRSASDLLSKKTLEDGTVVIDGELRVAKEYVDTLIAKDITTQTLIADHAEIKTLKVEHGEFQDLTTKNFEAVDATIKNLKVEHGEFQDLTTKNFEAVNGTIKNLDTKYANIDFSNIDKAAMEYFYASSGLIQDVTIGEATITGKLVGVTISGDLIEGSTVKADKLVIKGNDGLYYKLNTDGVSTTAEQTEYNSLNGSVILAKSITADKVKVTDLVAFGATIGGFNIGDQSLYSGVKESIDNTTRGIYLDTDGQVSFGDNKSFLKYYKDTDGTYKLKISASSVTFGLNGTDLDTALGDIQGDVDNLRDEITTLLRIESSRGTVFKNDTISTVLSVVIYHGTQRITDSTTMKNVFGNSAYLQWKWQRIDEESFGIISSSDSRFGDNGFTFTLSPEDVDTKVTFMCELMT